MAGMGTAGRSKGAGGGTTPLRDPEKDSVDEYEDEEDEDKYEPVAPRWLKVSCLSLALIFLAATAFAIEHAYVRAAAARASPATRLQMLDATASGVPSWAQAYPRFGVVVCPYGQPDASIYVHPVTSATASAAAVSGRKLQTAPSPPPPSPSPPAPTLPPTPPSPPTLASPPTPFPYSPRPPPAGAATPPSTDYFGDVSTDRAFPSEAHLVADTASEQTNDFATELAPTDLSAGRTGYFTSAAVSLAPWLQVRLTLQSTTPSTQARGLLVYALCLLNPTYECAAALTSPAVLPLASLQADFRGGLASVPRIKALLNATAPMLKVVSVGQPTGNSPLGTSPLCPTVWPNCVQFTLAVQGSRHLALSTLQTSLYNISVNSSAFGATNFSSFLAGAYNAPQGYRLEAVPGARGSYVQNGDTSFAFGPSLTPFGEAGFDGLLPLFGGAVSDTSACMVYQAGHPLSPGAAFVDPVASTVPHSSSLLLNLSMAGLNTALNAHNTGVYIGVYDATIDPSADPYRFVPPRLSTMGGFLKLPVSDWGRVIYPRLSAAAYAPLAHYNGTAATTAAIIRYEEGAGSWQENYGRPSWTLSVGTGAGAGEGALAAASGVNGSTSAVTTFLSFQSFFVDWKFEVTTEYPVFGMTDAITDMLVYLNCLILSWLILYLPFLIPRLRRVAAVSFIKSFPELLAGGIAGIPGGPVDPNDPHKGVVGIGGVGGWRGGAGKQHEDVRLPSGHANGDFDPFDLSHVMEETTAAYAGLGIDPRSVPKSERAPGGTQVVSSTIQSLIPAENFGFGMGPLGYNLPSKAPPQTRPPPPLLPPSYAPPPGGAYEGGQYGDGRADTYMSPDPRGSAPGGGGYGEPQSLSRREALMQEAANAGQYARDDGAQFSGGQTGAYGGSGGQAYAGGFASSEDMGAAYGAQGGYSNRPPPPAYSQQQRAPSPSPRGGAAGDPREAQFRAQQMGQGQGPPPRAPPLGTTGGSGSFW